MLILLLKLALVIVSLALLRWEGELDRVALCRRHCCSHWRLSRWLVYYGVPQPIQVLNVGRWRNGSPYMQITYYCIWGMWDPLWVQ